MCLVSWSVVSAGLLSVCPLRGEAVGGRCCCLLSALALALLSLALSWFLLAVQPFLVGWSPPTWWRWCLPSSC